MKKRKRISDASVADSREKTASAASGAGRMKVPQNPAEVLIATQGQCYHLDNSCEGLNKRQPQRRRACEICVGALGEDSTSAASGAGT